MLGELDRPDKSALLAEKGLLCLGSTRPPGRKGLVLRARWWCCVFLSVSGLLFWWRRVTPLVQWRPLPLGFPPPPQPAPRGRFGLLACKPFSLHPPTRADWPLRQRRAPIGVAPAPLPRPSCGPARRPTGRLSFLPRSRYVIENTHLYVLIQSAIANRGRSAARNGAARTGAARTTAGRRRACARGGALALHERRREGAHLGLAGWLARVDLRTQQRYRADDCNPATIELEGIGG